MMLALNYGTPSLSSCLTLIMVKTLLHDPISRILKRECWMAALTLSGRWLREKIYKPPLHHGLGFPSSIPFRQALLDSSILLSRIISSQLSAHATCSHKALLSLWQGLPFSAKWQPKQTPQKSSLTAVLHLVYAPTCASVLTAEDMK